MSLLELDCSTAGVERCERKTGVSETHRNRLSLSLWSPLPCVHRLLPQCIFHSTTKRCGARSGHRRLDDHTLTIIGRPRKLCGSCSRRWRGMVNKHTPEQDFASAHGHGAYPHQCRDQTDACKRSFGHIRVIIIPPHTTSFLQPCDVGLMRPFKSTIRRTACEKLRESHLQQHR